MTNLILLLMTTAAVILSELLSSCDLCLCLSSFKMTSHEIHCNTDAVEGKLDLRRGNMTDYVAKGENNPPPENNNSVFFCHLMVNCVSSTGMYLIIVEGWNFFE
jgi:hypothetical protein